MKIAVYHNLPSGGAKRTLYETVSRLIQRHDVHVYSLSTADETFCDLRPLVCRFTAYQFAPSRLFRRPFGRLNQLQRWRDLLRLDRLARRIAADMDAESFDVVLAQPCMWSQAPLVLRYLETPSVYYCQEPPRVLYESFSPAGTRRAARAALDAFDPLIALYRGTARRVDREAARAAGVMLVNSEFMRTTAARIYGRAPVVTYHGVDTRIFRPHPEIRREDYVLSVGAIQPHKGFDFLIESLGSLPEGARPGLRLVGNAQLAEQRRFLEELAARRGVSLYIEVGLSEEMLVRRYCEAAVLAYAPHREPFGLVPLEAMACGTPVVAVAEGGVRESVVDGVSGVLVERDSHRFAGAVRQLLGSRSLRQTLGRQARDLVLKHWTWEAAVERVEAHLERAASGTVAPQWNELPVAPRQGSACPGSAANCQSTTGV